MGSSLRKYLTKFILILCIIIILSFTATTVIFNIIIASQKNTITQTISKYAAQKIALGNIAYLPPNFLIFSNIAILEKIQTPEKQILFIPKIRAAFSLKAFIGKGDLFITDIYCYNPQGDYSDFFSFLKNNFQQIIALFYTLPKIQTIKFTLKDAILDLDQKNRITACFALVIKGDFISGSGSVSKGDKQSLSEPLSYNFKGSFMPDGFSVENLEFIRGDLYAKLWGKFSANTLALSGFAFSGRTTPALIELSQDDLNIFDINCRINLKFPQVQIERLSFSLNNIPFSLKGSVFLLEPVSIELSLSSYPGWQEDTWLDNPKRIDLMIRGTWQEAAFSGRLNLDFIRKHKGEPSLEKAEIDLKKLTFDFAEWPHLKMYLQDGDFFYHTSSNNYQASFKDFKAIFRLQNERFKFVEFYSLFYDGFLEGEGRIDIAQLPYRTTFNIKIKEVSANKLEGILTHFSKVYGRLTSQIYYQNYPHLNLRGTLNLQKGDLNNFDFFNWLADFFNLPSLKRINFDRLSADFSVTPEDSRLEKINLDSNQVNLKGYYILRENDLVASSLSLTLPREVLRESPKFIPLINLLGKDLSAFTFDFQISGMLQAMNFKWLESDFKNKLKNSIPGFVERRIEKGVEEAIAPLR